MNLDFQGPAGRLEGCVDEPRIEFSGWVAVVCHPHPLFGGTYRNIVTHRLARGLTRAGMLVLRFNFRGVGRSAGEHDGGVGETDDLRAAATHVTSMRPGSRLLVAGYSFGAHVASCFAVEDARVEALLMAGPALRVSSFDHLIPCAKPKYLLVAENDEFGEAALIRPLFERLALPKELTVFPGAGHTFSGCLSEIEDQVALVGDRLAQVQ